VPGTDGIGRHQSQEQDQRNAFTYTCCRNHHL
jgi:hypothetical protein